jgi:signal recognition particle receptor subunit beta
MARASQDKREVNASIVYWGVEGSGKTTNLKAIYANLRSDHRGELRELPTRLDPTVRYQVLPIELGAVAGVRTRIELVAVPGRPDQAPTRKQLLDEVDGIVLVVDSRSERIDENLQSFEELRQGLGAYGRSFEDVPLVIQYNKRDLADPYAIEDLHRKLDLPGVAVFEAVATEGTAVLPTLSTISKRVVRNLREEAAPAAPAAPAPATPTERLESAILAEEQHPDADAIVAAARRTESLLDGVAPEPPPDDGGRGVRLGPDLSIVSVGRASVAGERTVRVPLILGDAEGRTSRVVLTIQLDPLIDEAPG